MSLLLLFRPRHTATPVVLSAGGGGFGAVMHASHTQRYSAAYRDEYRPGYVSKRKKR